MINPLEQIDFSGFLAGSPQVPLRWRRIHLQTEPSPSEWHTIEHFQWRANEFLLNVQDLNLSGHRSLSIDRGGQRTKVSGSIYPGRHRAKSLYLDFRHFLADKEPAKFERVVNTLRRHLPSDDVVQAFLAKLKSDLLKNQELNFAFDGKNFSVSRLIDLWFNTEFFHAGRPVQIAERQELLATLEEEGAHHLMLWAVVDTAHTIKCLYACVRDLEPAACREVHCPDPRIFLDQEDEEDEDA